jgi:hypothetical protein
MDISRVRLNWSPQCHMVAVLGDECIHIDWLKLSVTLHYTTTPN